jgi:acetylornithine deacetylase/succinyl-diaminopimelate desuccinylase-like protein
VPIDPTWLEEVSEWLRIPSVSADPAHKADVRAAGEWLCDFVRNAGGECSLADVNERPLALGEIRASQNADSAATVMVYGHFDVQPPDPLDLWASPPFEPTIRDEWLYARGVADDKGQLYLQLKAAATLAAEGALPVNVRIACDGEEEIGGHSIVDWIRQDERGADACVIFDAHMPKRGQPAFYIATRGICYIHVKIRTGERDLHSGSFGGAALSATHALIRTLSGVLAGPDGRLPEPLRKGVVAPAPEEVADWALQQPGADVLSDQGARPMDATAADELYVRTWAEPSLDVNGVQGGSAQLQKTVIPVTAEANLSIRLAVGQKVEEIVPEVERLLRESAPSGADLEIDLWSAGSPGLVAPDSPVIRLGQDAFERALGTRPLLLRSGGTLPIVPALADRGISTIVTGFDLPEGNLHSPNERLLVEHFPLGVAAARELFTSLAALKRSQDRSIA